MSSVMNEALLTLVETLALSFAAILLMVGGTVVVLRARMKRLIQDVPNVNISDWFIGTGSAIAIDQKRHLIYFCKAFWKKPRCIKPSEIAFPREDVAFILEHQFQGQSSEADDTLGGLVPFIALGKYLLRIPTNIYEIPEISVAFWSKKRAQQCGICIRALVQQPGPAVQMDMEKNGEKEKLIQALRSQIPAAEQLSKKVGKEPLHKHILFLKKNFETLCGRSYEHGDGKLITEALYAVLGREGEDPAEPGYTLKSLLSTVSRCKVSKSKFNEKKSS